MRFLLLLFLFGACLVSNAQSIKKKPAPKPTHEVSSAVLDSFESEILKEIEKKNIPGAAYLLYSQGKIVRMKAFGESDISTHRPMQTTDIFRLASMTKPIASLALLLLQEDGLINMNDRLDKYLPAFANPAVLTRIDTINGTTVIQTRPAHSPILLRHILTHTAGFASQYGGKLGDLYLSTFQDPSFNDLSHFANQLAKLPLNHEPGEDWVYGPGINVAARVIEVVTGMPFQDFLVKRIFAPLQMNETKFFLETSDASRLTTLYAPDEKEGMVVRDPGTAASKLISGPKVYYSGSGGLTSTLNDYLKFCVMVLNNGVYEGRQIAKPETIAFMRTDQAPLHINANLSEQPGQLTEGFTFGYQIVRRENNQTLKPKGTIGWSGATGPIFFIDPAHQLIGIYMFQMQPYSKVTTRKQFADYMVKSVR
jgi:CubicO group peptidase (beta-lactamase class C family)